MPMLNFKTRFVEPIRAGQKSHTIRGERKVPVKPGDRLFLYCGARTKNCFRILPEPVTCWLVQDIIIEAHPRDRIFLEGQYLDRDECERLAQADGFDSFGAMMQFWEGRLPFRGQIIHWRKP
jgi:hypothetical protein